MRDFFRHCGLLLIAITVVAYFFAKTYRTPWEMLQLTDAVMMANK